MELNPALIVAVTLALVVVLLAWLRRRARAAALATMLAKGAVVLDVRSPEEFAGGHHPAAVNLPLPNLRGKVGKVIAGKDTAVIVCCASGMRSRQAAEIMGELGYTTVKDAGGWGNVPA